MTRKAVAYVIPDDEPALPAGLELLASSSDLADALRSVVEEQADVLFAQRLRALAGSLSELVRLLDWLQAAGAELLTTDPPLDTASTTGRRQAALLRELDRWEREPEHPRRPRGRPGLAAAAPELAERIASLHERGLSLHAIAEELNRDGIPTPRGGAAWRASSVQSALGYRRPRPPVPGAPPPGKHDKHHKPKKPGPAGKGPRP